MRYLKLWECLLDNEKIQGLDDKTFKSWIYLLVCAKRNDADGDLPELKTLVFWCRKKEKIVQQWVDLAATAKLIEWTGSCWHVHDWEYWQAPYDPTAKTRMQRYRDRRNPPVTDRNIDRNVTVPVTPVRRECESVRVKKVESPLPPEGERPPPLDDPAEADPPEYPDPLTSMHIIMTGEHRIEEADARQIWGDLWRSFKNSKLCYQFYEHQQWLTAEEWLYAIKTAVERRSRVESIRFLEKIGYDMEAGMAKQTKPVTRGEIGPVPYKPTLVGGGNQPPVIPMNHPPMPGHMSRAEYEAQRARAR
jgi:hypothetical protein